MSASTSRRFGVRVSSRVIAPDDLERRLASALATIDPSIVPRHTSGTAVGGSASDAARARAELLHRLWATVTVEPITVGPGPRGRAAHIVKRLVRRATAWYVEPRWAAQLEIDAEVARFASDSVRSIEDLRSEVAQLNASLDRAQTRIRDLEARQQRTAAQDTTPA
jgi:hypothetical protein